MYSQREREKEHTQNIKSLWIHLIRAIARCYVFRGIFQTDVCKKRGRQIQTKNIPFGNMVEANGRRIELSWNERTTTQQQQQQQNRTTHSERSERVRSLSVLLSIPPFGYPIHTWALDSQSSSTHWLTSRLRIRTRLQFISFKKWFKTATRLLMNVSRMIRRRHINYTCT